MNGPLPPHSPDDSDRRNATRIFADAIPDPFVLALQTAGKLGFSTTWLIAQILPTGEKSQFGNGGFRDGTPSKSASQFLIVIAFD